jgi:hypothetical protein
VVTVSSGYLLDTNVISELMKARPARSVADWIVSTPEELMHLSVITIGEIRKGIDLLDEMSPGEAHFRAGSIMICASVSQADSFPSTNGSRNDGATSRHSQSGNVSRFPRSMPSSPQRRFIMA